MRFQNSTIQAYLQDPILHRLATEIQNAGPIRPAVVDVTHSCNLRCTGCYFFAENMDRYRASRDSVALEEFIAREKQRGTNYMTVVGGEPALVLDRLKRLHENFHILPYTNGLRPIPWKGFETLNIAVSLWGGHEIDKTLRGYGKIDVFEKGLSNYKNDPRVVWYYTTTPGHAHDIEAVVKEIVDNGNLIQFSYYEDHAELGGAFDHAQGFDRVRTEIDRVIKRYPEHILTTSYLNKVSTTNRLFDQSWGHEVCPVISVGNPINQKREQNGFRFIPHMRVYLPDLTTTRRCPVGNDHDCSACYNALARSTWIMINQDLHLGSKEEFTNWLTTVYTFYLFIGIISRWKASSLMPEIHRRLEAQYNSDDARMLA